MKSEFKASLLAAVYFSLCGTSAFSQSILNQSKDDLLKDFDVGKTLTAPPGPQFSGTANPAPPANWAPNKQSGNGPQTGLPQGFSPNAGLPANTAPQVLNQQVGQQNAPTQSPVLLGNYGQGPNQNPPQKRLLQRIIEGAMNAVNISKTDGNGTHVKAPFVDVNVGGPDGVKVKAPFVKYNADEGPQVKAPFVKYNSADGAQVKAPLVNINSPSENQGSSLK